MAFRVAALLPVVWQSLLPEMRAAGVSETAVGRTDPQGPPEHPAVVYLGHVYKEHVVHRVDGELVKTAETKMQCAGPSSDAPSYLRALMHSEVSLERPRASGARTLNLTWIGWNHMITKRVDRYLIVKEVNDLGEVISAECTTYPDVDPQGYPDPLPLILDRFNLTTPRPDQGGEYFYTWALQSGAQQVALLTTDAQSHPLWAHVNVSSKDSFASYEHTFELLEDAVDDSLFWEYQEHECATVSNFTRPEICMNLFLELQYECDVGVEPAESLTV